MMMTEWNKISYMVQLIAACIITMIPGMKREGYKLRMVMSSAVLLIISYAANSFIKVEEIGLMQLLYWGTYLLFIIGMTWLCMETSLYTAIFCSLCACAVQHIAFDFMMITELSGVGYPLIFLGIYILVFMVYYLFFVKKIYNSGLIEVNRNSIISVSTIVLIVWFISVMEMWVKTDNTAMVTEKILFRILDMLCCFYAVWVQVSQKENIILQRDIEGIQMTLSRQKEQYDIKMETIDRINRKCHDLKHQLRALKNISMEDEREEYIKGLENDIMIYDSTVDTGNKQLDVILMDKLLFCKNHFINFTCMADGSRLGFMKPHDIYALFGNALDNAITAVLKIDEHEKRVLDLKIIDQSDIMVIQVQNYFEGTIKYENGMPVTTKYEKNEHGFGIKSMRYTAEKYGGTITTNAKDNIFTLQILLPEL